MSTKLLIGLLTTTAVAFFAALVAVIGEHGLVGAFEASLSGLVGLQVGLDLTLALLFLGVWIWHDAPAHGLPRWPYLALTALTGSAGPLLYLAHRVWAVPEQPLARVRRESVAPSLLWSFAILVDAFLILTAWMVWDVGVAGFVDAMTANSAAWFAFADLCLSLMMVLAWMISDARHSERTVWPFVLLTFCFGSLGWLVWFGRDLWDRREKRAFQPA